jgi:hypothetical protein
MKSATRSSREPCKKDSHDLLVSTVLSTVGKNITAFAVGFFIGVTAMGYLLFVVGPYLLR